MTSNRLIRRTMGAVAAPLALVLTLAACGSSSTGDNPSSTSSGSSTGSDTAGAQPGAGKPQVVLGTKDFSEQFLLGQLYTQALRAKGYTIKLQQNIGSSEVIDKALTSGKIDGYPEYTGVIYSNTDLANAGDMPKSAAETYQVAKKFENGRGYAMLEPTPFQDADGFAVTNAYAKQNGLTTIADMSKVGAFTYAGPPENATRYQGVVGLKQGYGLTKVQFKPLATGSQYQALDQGQVDSIAVFTTDGQLASGKYKVLTDPKGIFGYQNVAPVIKQSVLDQQGPEFADTLNQVSALLTTKAIVAMNSAVQLAKQDPAAVAKSFLQQNGLL